MEQQLEMFEFQPLRGDHAVIRQSYDEVVRSVARLASYGVAGELLELGADVTNRQTQLAIDDLIHLAIAGRRLIKSVSSSKDAKNIRIPQIRLLEDGRHIIGHRIHSMIDVLDALNRLVHSVSVNVIGYEWQALDLSVENALARYMRLGPTKLMPVCAVTNEKNETAIFHVISLCHAMSEVLDLAAQRGIQHELYLEDFFKT